DAVLLGDTLDLIAIGLGFGRLLDVEEAPVPARDLHALIAEAACPLADRFPGIEGLRIARKLSQENRRPLDVLRHSVSPFVRALFLEVAVHQIFEIFLPARDGLGIGAVL